ncbi:hypothetical protein EV147_2866 [Cupriavidus agavae]|uniref:HNH endonuclease n=1 Tax=Cupriavidus agavae TaxID=1001822 RepID=A0A4V2FGY5_9BURK|nr:hypothetical protein EV147_2866 [Cupriavidus agavae]
MPMRDEFSPRTKETLAKRVGQRCSNPDCRRATSGPHEESCRAVNIGVASHITAAAVCGPRYENSLSPSQRAGISNGIWLCQVCAKLVDSDVMRYTSEVLYSWKREAEFHANAELMGRLVTDYLPQPASALHAPIPRMAGLTYHEARARLIEAGWQPRMSHWSHGNDPNLRTGNGSEFWSAGCWEIINACPTGLAQCMFALHDAYGNHLTVLTEGEENNEQGWRARVSNWFFSKDS